MTDEAIERIELKLAYLERASQELSEVVFRQQREIDELKARLASVVNEVEAGKSGRAEYTPLEERPPHY